MEVANFGGRALLVGLLRLAVICSTALLTTFVVLDTFSSLALAHSNVPFWDQWAVLHRIELIENGRIGFWSTLWEAHAGHRMVLPQLLHFLNASLLRYESCAPILLSLLIQASVAFLYVRVLARSSAPNWIRWCIGFVVCATLFSSYCLENFVWPMQISYLLAYGPALYGLWWLTDGRERRAPHWSYLAAGISGIIASLSMLQGLAFWPCAITGILMRRRRRLAVAATILMMFLLSAYFIDYPWPDLSTFRPSEGAGLALWMRRLVVFALFLGAPMSHISPYAGIAFGSVFVLLCIDWIAATAGARFAAGGARSFLIASLAFSVSCTLLIVTGRYAGNQIISLWNDLANSIVVSRYLMVTYYGWLSLLLLSLCTPWSTLGRRCSGTVLVLCVVVMTFFTIPNQRRHSAWWVDFFRTNDAIGSSLIAGVFDEEGLRRLADAPPFETFSRREFLRDRGLALFAEPRARWLGDELDRARLETGRCRGSIEHVELLGRGVAPGVKLRGALRSDMPAPSRDVVLLDPGGRIAGIGRTGLSHGATRAGWLAYSYVLALPVELTLAVPNAGRWLICDTVR